MKQEIISTTESDTQPNSAATTTAAGATVERRDGGSVPPSQPELTLKSCSGTHSSVPEFHPATSATSASSATSPAAPGAAAVSQPELTLKSTSGTHSSVPEFHAPAAPTSAAAAAAPLVESAVKARQETKADKAFRRHVKSTYWRESNRWALVVYDVVIFALVYLVLFILFPGRDYMAPLGLFARTGVIMTACCIVGAFITKTYRQVWRYAIYTAYLRLIAGYLCGAAVAFVIIMLLPPPQISIMRVLAGVCCALLGSIVIRLVYQLLTIKASKPNGLGKFLRGVLRVAGTSISKDDFTPLGDESLAKVRVAVVGAGRVGSSLVADIWANPNSYYEPVCFIDKNPAKVGRLVSGLPVIAEQCVTNAVLDDQDVQEVILALPQTEAKAKTWIFQRYRAMGRKVLTYDFPLGSPLSESEEADEALTNQAASAGRKLGRRFVREFDIEELLLRDPIYFDFSTVAGHYQDKVVMVTGGGGSIGSEICRQVAKMKPARLVILDIIENGAYDVQQELRMAYGSNLDVCIELCDVCDKPALERKFAKHRPDVVLHAAAHKHVPIVEADCVRGVKNNVFGTLNAVELAEEYRVHRFILISTDKAVNPTNVMGATKRMCEMIVQAHGRMAQQEGGCGTIFSAVRFGNVLGSAGSVVPLFKRQILAGGPVTITDRRIIRYFMTIPEATQLVLLSGIMAKAGELFVLDMGQPVRILDLAYNMITLMGFTPDVDIEIKETGLRPGEKLYEELLIRDEEVDKTENSRIFIERDDALTLPQLDERLGVLRQVMEAGDEGAMKDALKSVIPTFKDPSEVNAVAAAALQLAEEARNAFESEAADEAAGKAAGVTGKAPSATASKARGREKA